MRTLRLWTFLLLTWLLAPWAWAGGAAAVHAGHPGHAAHGTAVGTPIVTQAVTAPCAMHAADHPRARPASKRPPCGDCAACHVVALPAHHWALSSPEPLSASPQGQPQLDQGRLRPFELDRPPRA